MVSLYTLVMWGIPPLLVLLLGAFAEVTSTALTIGACGVAILAISLGAVRHWREMGNTV
jgi:hypothetical protein